ncbi:GtrA family protein [Lacibacter sp.]|jgi:putative flippase GtrA|uniref:GtrA family protein n=1 Tax=Lacibacter sp. TaxID=1915409 RepID=UPI002B4B0124|nr:GtrA family protein [Lacibacter sp.]HLP39305.1 GtrA family protein [Lacibacter sp.]
MTKSLPLPPLMINSVVAFIHAVIDWFYPPFKKFMPMQTFRYAACGGGNTVLDILLFYISYNFILNKEMVHTPFMTVSPHIAAFLMSFVVTFPVGFFLSRYVVFEGSAVRKREQLPKYMIVVAGAILLNYFFLKIFVETFHMYATLAKICTTFFVVAFSYFSQKYFTFKVS